jgi:uncharacterized protein
MEQKIIIKVSELLNRSQQYTGQVSGSLLELANDSFTTPSGKISYNFTATKIENEILIRGIITIPFLFRCSRCNEFFNKEIKIADFTRTYHSSSDSELIDLTEDVREDILLALPSYWVCSNECQGLCVRCGINLNKARCKCGRRKEQNVWNVLDKIAIKKHD